MSNMKCPFCQQELEVGGVDGKLRGCPKCRNLGTEMFWVELIRTRKTLEQSEICCTEWEKQALDYKAENINLSDKIGKLETELERTRKALDVGVDAIDEILVLDSGKFIQEPVEMWKIAKSAKDKITALEQKD